jgi:tRNA/tmRNA/rRNA uracil-C5-methylase (TrmA/RlmC/RlmD family)
VYLESTGIPMQVYIEKIVHGGYGFGRIDNSVVLVTYAAPGDVLEVRLQHNGQEGARNPLFADIQAIVEPSPLRRSPSCPVFGLCGGCDYDHLPYERELSIKVEVLQEDLFRIAGLEDAPIGKPVPSSSEYGYRNNAQIKVGRSGEPGFFMKRSYRVIPFPVEGCLLLDGPLNALLQHIMSLKLRVGSGMKLRSNAEGEVFSRGVPGRSDDAFVYDRVGNIALRYGVHDFFQVNKLMRERWVELVEHHLEPEPGDRLVDLYCGSGLIALYLAKSVRAVSGVEGNGSSVRNAVFNAGLNDLGNVSFHIRDLTRVEGLADLIPRGRGDLKLVVDPPRTGLGRRAVDAVSTLAPERIVYASCNSATLSRDIALLGERGYEVSRVDPIDMFPRTHHLETVTTLMPPSRLKTQRA